MEYVFTFSSTHRVISGEQMLLGQGIPVRVMPLPSQIGAGCGLCLRVSPQDFRATKNLLEEHAIPFDAIYEMVRTQGKSTCTLWEEN